MGFFSLLKYIMHIERTFAMPCEDKFEHQFPDSGMHYRWLFKYSKHGISDAVR